MTEPTATSTADWGVVNGDSAHDAGAQAGDASNVDASTPQDADTKPQTNGVHAENSAEVKPSIPASFAAKAGAKVPAAPVRSWAQIAKCVYCMSSFAMPSNVSFPFLRPQEKPKVAPAPAAPAPPPPVQEPVAATPEPEKQPEPEPTGWEEPTTAQAPTWDDEPQPPQPTAIADDWPPTETEEVKPEPVSEKPSPAPVQQPLQEPEPAPVSAPTAIPANVRQKLDSAITPPNKPTTPVSYARSLSSRAGNRFKTGEQAVVMPSSAFGASVEKLGMQFGSVGLGDDEP